MNAIEDAVNGVTALGTIIMHIVTYSSSSGLITGDVGGLFKGATFKHYINLQSSAKRS